MTCVLIRGAVRCSPVVRFLAQMNIAVALLWGGDSRFPSPHLSVSGGRQLLAQDVPVLSHCLKPSGIPITYWVMTLQLGIQSFRCSSLCSLSWHSYSDFPEGHMAHPHSHCQPCCIYTYPCAFTHPPPTFPFNWAIFPPISFSPQNSI